MELISILILALLFFLVSLISGNNLPVCSGTIIATKIVNVYTGIILTIVGYISGLIVQGNFLSKGVQTIFVYDTEASIMLALSIAIIIFLLSHYYSIPQSFSVNFASVLVGISVASNNQIDWGYVLFMITFWIIAPLLSIFLIIIVMNLSLKFINKERIWLTLKAIRISLVILSFLSAFVLGANTFGLLYNSVLHNEFSLIIFIFAIIFGSFIFSSREIKRISFEIIPIRYLNAISSMLVSFLVVEIATFLSIPLSNTQAFTASLYGAGLSYKTRYLLRKPLITISLIWILGAFISFSLGYLLFRLFITNFNF